jgi:hypothetical protein
MSLRRYIQTGSVFHPPCSGYQRPIRKSKLAGTSSYGSTQYWAAEYVGILAWCFGKGLITLTLWDLRLQSFGIQHRVVRMWTDVSEECITSIFWVENQPNKKPACSRWTKLVHVPPFLPSHRSQTSYRIPFQAALHNLSGAVKSSILFLWVASCCVCITNI